MPMHSTRSVFVSLWLIGFWASSAAAQIDVTVEGGRLSWQHGARSLGSGEDWLQVRDLAGEDTFTAVPVTGTESTFNGDGMGLRLEGQWRPRGFAKELTLTVTAVPPKDRAVILRVALPLEAEGWGWWDDMGTRRSIEAGRRYERLTRWGGLRDVSAYPLCAVGSDDLGLSVAVPLHEPQVFRLAYDASHQALEAEFDLGLSPDAAKFPCRSTVRLLLYAHDPAWGFRSAMQRYYELYPEYAQRRVGAGGIWLIGLAPNTMASPWDWGFRFEEHGLEHAGYNDLHDILTFVYTECWGIYEGFGDNPPPDGKDRYGRNVYLLEPEQMRQFIHDKLQAGPEQEFWGLPRSEVAQAEVNSAIEDADGQWIWSHYTQTWSPGNFLCNLCLNPDPDIPAPSRNSVTWDAEITPAYRRAENGGGRLGGVYLDSVCGYVGFHDENYRRDHWQYADTPLVAGYKTQRPTQLHCFSCLEISGQIADRMRAEGRYVIGNTGPPEMTYWIPLLDMIGAGESSQCGLSDERHYRYLRFCAYHKPVSWMQYGFVDPKRSWEEKERGMHRCLFYAVHPGTARFNAPAEYEPSRPLYRYYEPLIAWLDEAGWQPVTRAHSADPEVLVERYGPGEGVLSDMALITLRNGASRPKSAQVTVQSAALPASAGGEVIARALVANYEAEVSRTDTGHTISGVSVEPDTTEVLALGTREAVARLFLEQGRQWLDRLEREGRWFTEQGAGELIANGSFEGGLTSCGLAAPPNNMKEATVELEQEDPLSGKASARAQSRSEASLHGMNQSVALSADDQYTLRFTYSWTRPEGAGGTFYPRFGVKGPDGEWAPDKYITFRDLEPTGGETATYERSFTVPEGCTTGFFQFMFSGHWGTVVLDEVKITSAGLEAVRERIGALHTAAAAAESALRAALQDADGPALLALTARQEQAYQSITERIEPLPEGHVRRCFSLPTRNFADSIGRATEVLTAASVGFPAGPPFSAAVLGQETKLACRLLSTRHELAEARAALDGVPPPTGADMAVGQERLVPVSVTVPTDVPWGWHDALVVTRFRVDEQSLWLPRRVTLRPRLPLEVHAAEAITALQPTLSLSIRSWLPQPMDCTLEATATIGDTQVPLAARAFRVGPGEPTVLSLPLPEPPAAQVDALAAGGKACKVHWRVLGEAGTAYEGDLEADLRRAVRSAKLSSTPTIDGELRAGEWDQAASLSGFVTPDDAGPTDRRTEVFVGHDDNALYVAYVCRDQPRPKAQHRPRDGAVWEDDAVELFLQPPDAQTYYHLAVNAAGSRFDARCPGSDATWQPEWEAQAGRNAEGWVVEIAVPWAALQANPGNVWRVNFGRENADTKQATCWSPTGGGFHVPARFGDMAL